MSIYDLDAYELILKEDLSDLKSKGSLLRHKKSGARVLLMENDDENKVFSIGFRTPPSDSTGVPHIMEHSVLCGSRDFPVKDPFVELVKGSLNTFLNAMTYPDKTVYPVASCNDKDFQNLMHVYMDAVFYPNIYEHEEIFRQEGWSYKLDSPDGDLEYNGVVYNEMKGAFSSPEGVLDRVILNSLFPDTSYANESGGDPEFIPELTYEQFLNFHRKYYHPSNSYIYLYGDMDMKEKLQWLDREYLSRFDQIPLDSEIKYQKPFEKVKELEIEYSISSEETEEDNTYLSYNKVIGTSLDERLYLAFQILDYALLSAPGAPLKKALVDAGIGKDIMGSYDNGIYQPIFSVIAKNANLEQKEEFLSIIEGTLKDIVEKGIDKKALEAGINYHEFRFREADFGNYPKGLMYGLQMFDSWLYDEEKPFIHMQAIPTFDFLKGQMNTGYFESLIQTYLLDNTHASVVVVKPEKGRTARQDKELADKLQVYKRNLSREEINKLVEDTKSLLAYQEEESPKEDQEKIPVLSPEDISREIAPICNEEKELDGIKMIHHNVETNGIGYITLMFDLSGVPEEKLVYAGLLQAVLGMIDTNHYGYGELFNEINVHTGGIGTSLELYADVTKVKEKEFRATLEMKGKALYPKMDILLAMMREILMESKLDDEKRLKEILAMLKSRMQMSFQSSGHTTAALRALSYDSPLAKFKDDTEGIGFYQAVKEIEENFEEKKAELIRNLKAIAMDIFRADNMMISYTSAEEGLESIKAGIGKIKSGLHEEPKPEETPCIIHCKKRNEGFKTSSKVQYVARVGNFIDHGADYNGALQILKVILSYDYLWQNVRVKGGAYGCMSSFNRIGEGYFISYRDPNLRKTMETYKGVVNYLRKFTVDERDMNKYIIGTISNIDRPMTPATKGDRSMNLYMNHVSADMIRKERMEILGAQQEDIRALADVVEAVLAADQLCVIGSEEKIEEQKDMFGEVKTLF
ncbi:insulinase family protein [Muricomes sp. OA1]|uniref:Peptidase M16 n=2 Tax=Lachnospiraceae TaxID=186803 RepID=A0A3E2WYC0_9FIRM|nr:MULTISPECIES: insulinase family protein [Clostridia]MCH1973011.1 insulinase family protein [Muricomes sp. OA1]RGC33320.1 peptidase M16 [Hungatella hathewayi]GKH31786.1 peptidase [Faecalicatena contorta]